MVFGVFDFLKKMNDRIRLYYYDTSSRLVFVHFLEEIEDTKKPFRNYLTFNRIKTCPIGKFCANIFVEYFQILLG